MCKIGSRTDTPAGDTLAAAAQTVQVDVYTAHHDRRRCFQETLDGPFSVTVCGSWFPRTVCNRFTALCTYVRCIAIAIYVAWVAWRCGRIPWLMRLLLH